MRRSVDHPDDRLTGAQPMDALAAWPRDEPVVMLHSGRFHPRWARWSILARPRAYAIIEAGGVEWVGEPPTETAARAGTAADPAAALAAILDGRDHSAAGTSALPFVGGWIGALSYDLGRVIEPAAADPQSAGIDDRRWPLAMLAWCPDAIIFDALHRTWHPVGDPPRAAPLGTTRTRGAADERAEAASVLPIARERSHRSLMVAARGDDSADPQRPEMRRGTDRCDFTSTLPRDAYVDRVRRTVDLIAAGDLFQANIAQRLTTPFAGSTRDLAARAFAVAEPWYGGYLELPGGRAIISMSPELFLEVDPTTRRVITRPIKGTRPAGVAADVLRDSAKDAAELNMIIDLMRNDLGRVCEFGSVRVPHGRVIETHPTVHHGVGEVHGTLRPGVTPRDLLRATFPPGSVTGAPKIRAMQVIDALEPVRRGPYCGALGCFSRCGAMTLNVAIRTALLTGRRPDGRWDELEGVLDYGAGGGIVADSDPAAEYVESMDKTEVLRRLLAGSDASGAAVGRRDATEEPATAIAGQAS